MSDAAQLRSTIAVAFRHFDDPDTTGPEREAILVVAAEDLGGREGELAARILQHRRESATLQLEMRALLDGIGDPATGKDGV